MISNLLQSIIGDQTTIDGIVQTVNSQCTGSKSASTQSAPKPADFPTLTGPSATEMAWLAEYTS
jgi:hypothetical protein